MSSCLSGIYRLTICKFCLFNCHETGKTPVVFSIFKNYLRITGRYIYVSYPEGQWSVLLEDSGLRRNTSE